MATNPALDASLITKAQSTGGAKVKKAAVTEAREEYILRRKQVRITTLFGEVDYDPDYDYKKYRLRR
jgi:hypothetical protein